MDHCLLEPEQMDSGIRLGVTSAFYESSYVIARAYQNGVFYLRINP